MAVSSVWPHFVSSVCWGSGNEGCWKMPYLRYFEVEEIFFGFGSCAKTAGDRGAKVFVLFWKGLFLGQQTGEGR